MNDSLARQTLLLELLGISGNIAATHDISGTILSRTLEECRAAGWVSTTRIGSDLLKVGLTEAGRARIKNQAAQPR